MHTRHAGWVPALAGFALFCLTANAQSSPAVPRLVNFSGKAADAQGKTISGIAGATFAIYKDQYDGAPLWLETQNVHPDAEGNYTVQLARPWPRDCGSTCSPPARRAGWASGSMAPKSSPG